MQLAGTFIQKEIKIQPTVADASRYAITIFAGHVSTVSDFIHILQRFGTRTTFGATQNSLSRHQVGICRTEHRIIDRGVLRAAWFQFTAVFAHVSPLDAGVAVIEIALELLAFYPSFFGVANREELGTLVFLAVPPDVVCHKSLVFFFEHIHQPCLYAGIAPGAVHTYPDIVAHISIHQRLNQEVST